MPDSTPATPRSGTVPRIAGLVLAVVGAAGLIASVFLTWFTVKPDLASLFGKNLDVHAEVTGTGSVAFTATGPAAGAIEREGSVAVSSDAAWAGWTIVVLGAALLVAGGLAAFGPVRLRRPLTLIAAACGAFAAGVAGYALVVPVGTNTTRVGAAEFTVTTTGGPGQFVALAAAAVAVLGSLVPLLALRSTAGSVAQPTPQTPHPPVSPFLPVPPPHAAPASGTSVPPHAPSDQRFPPVEQVWARPVALPPPTPAPDAVPEAQTRTAVAPVARRRPQPDWDRNWPSAVPPQPESRPVVPSEQHTQIVKRPPRPVKVSPKPETEAIPRYDPRYDSPTEPL
ncbi:hypothetical protein FK268_05125 [Tsukamurella sputi]|uniref:Uncharacterized protein n=1 Tax=Tsukamurella sputi TaxID=2591848 RepID=A0A5C5RU78_9ACTN|nr:hypothetical protein [Tsukamurella sputi]TWS26606.1 hypothetical protein FK268_05125 [Tsukamurella sputi]